MDQRIGRSHRAAKPWELARLEALEPRLLLSADLPFISSVDADNRGQVFIQVEGDLIQATVNSDTVQLLTAGADGLLGTADDIAVDAEVSYRVSDSTIRILADLDGETRYVVRVDGDNIFDATGCKLDAEFNGPGEDSGDGVEGGVGSIFAGPNESEVVATITTIFGDIRVRLFPDETPETVANFLRYANEQLYDSTFFHRLVSDFVIQGGGFEANEDLEDIESFDPVINEPGISNTFGTIAMAKLGGDPNSATNEFFFNLDDNSENLDNQNGGFTVFGEIIGDDSFDVLDMLATADIVDASGQGGAFGDLPVLNAEAVEDNEGVVQPSDLLRITRVAVEWAVDGEPVGQFQAQESVAFASNSGQAQVFVYGLSGPALGDVSEFVDVKFAGNDIVQRITIRDGFQGTIGIQVTGASRVNAIVDLRSDDNPGELGFLVVDGPVNVLNLRQDIVGADLNGLAMAGGLIFDADIDGDGSTTDGLAVYVDGGLSRNLLFRGDLEGDVVLPGGVRNIRAFGAVDGTDFVIGDDGLAEGQSVRMNLNLDTVDDSSVRSDLPIRTLKATEWLSSGVEREIRAPAITSLRITGSVPRDIDGRLEANVTITGDPDQNVDLNMAFIRGGVSGSDWFIGGNAGFIRMLDTATDWNLAVAGDLRILNVEHVIGSEVVVDGGMNVLRAWQWDGGEIQTLRELRIFNVTGRAPEGLDGDFSGQLFINSSQSDDVVTQLIRVRGDLTNSEILAVGELRTARIFGSTIDSVIAGIGSWRTLWLDEAVNTTIDLVGDLNLLRTDDLSGVVGITEVRRIDVFGDFEGEMNVDFADRMRIHGSWTGDAEFRSVDDLRITGDLRDGNWRFVGGGEQLGFLQIGGSMQDMILRANGRLGSIVTGAMFDSDIYVGAPNNLFGLPDDGTGINLNAGIDSIKVLGFGQTWEPAFVNSYIVAGSIGDAVIAQPETDNGGTPFGIAAGSIDRIRTEINGVLIARDNPGQSLPAQGDYQVRVDFAPPA